MNNFAIPACRVVHCAQNLQLAVLPEMALEPRKEMSY